MLDLTITKEDFEFVLPVFQSPTAHLFERLTHEIEVATEEVHALVYDTADGSDAENDVVRHAIAYICCVSARRVLPQLDLVLTETGLGVVGNGNLVPASQARVSALNDSLRQKASQAWDNLLLTLLRTPWRESDAAVGHVSSLVWLPTLCRRYGITASKEVGIRINPMPVYDEEFDALRSSLAVAEAKVATMISPELYDYLVEQERTTQDAHTTAVSLLIERSRRLIGALMKEDTHPRSVAPLAKRLLETVEQYRDVLPQYTGSRTYEARQMPSYENKKEDAIFFFS